MGHYRFRCACHGRFILGHRQQSLPEPRFRIDVLSDADALFRREDNHCPTPAEFAALSLTLFLLAVGNATLRQIHFDEDGPDAFVSAKFDGNLKSKLSVGNDIDPWCGGALFVFQDRNVLVSVSGKSANATLR